MPRSKAGARAKMHLVDDEIVWIGSRYFDGFRQPFRLRIWRRKRVRAVVLSSQIPGGPPPYVVSSKLANWACSAYLSYHLPAPLFFEASLDEAGDWSLRAVEFLQLGRRDRLKFLDPQFTDVTLAMLEQLVGEPIEPGGELSPWPDGEPDAFEDWRTPRLPGSRARGA